MNDVQNQEGSPIRRRRILIPLLWIGLLLPWTWALLLPIPGRAAEVVGGPENMFTIGKVLHVSVYAVLAVLTAWLPQSPLRRTLLTLLLLIHGGMTEYLQRFVGRGSSLRDVLLDAAGVAIGVLLVSLWRRWRGFQAGSERPQIQLQSDGPGQHAETSDL